VAEAESAVHGAVREWHEDVVDRAVEFLSCRDAAYTLTSVEDSGVGASVMRRLREVPAARARLDDHGATQTLGEKDASPEVTH
jgi:hypothetical protein